MNVDQYITEFRTTLSEETSPERLPKHVVPALILAGALMAIRRVT